MFHETYVLGSTQMYDLRMVRKAIKIHEQQTNLNRKEEQASTLNTRALRGSSCEAHM